MALFGEKYGDVVRMVEVGDGGVSRELCGGTHVRSTAEIGLLRIVSETSSAANVRRIEALTGPAAVALVREHDRELEAVAALVRSTPAEVLEVVRVREEQRRSLLKSGGANGGAAGARVDPAALAATAVMLDGVPFVGATVEVADAKALPDVADRVKGQLSSDGVVVLASALDGRASVIVSVAPSVVARGVRAGDIAKVIAAVLGGGGGGRDTLAQAGGSEIGKLDEALATANKATAAALSA
jgi:alanyl-tRNA synthetase